MKFYHNIYIAIAILFISICIFLTTLYNYELSKVSNDKTLKTIVIEKGSISDIADTLYKENLIRNKTAFKIYIKLSGKHNLQAATYKLSKNMGTRKIIDILNKGKSYQKDKLVTFKEGINIRKIISIITKETNNKEEDIINLLKDDNYLDELINKYWFLDNNIKNKDIYYSLEGYLYPNSYMIAQNESAKDIFTKMLNETDKQLTPYKDKITNNKLNTHEIFTLASIVELEGTNTENRKDIASVFFNRINSGMTLGSDVTTYYGAKVDMGERDLYSNEVSACNNYNTRCSTFKGLPIGPIANPNIETINAVLEPNKTNYYYFVADKNKKIYFSKNNTEHINTINRLKREGLWFEY